MTAYTYMVRCADGSLYTGWTTDLKRRIDSHNLGVAAKYTRSRRPVSLVACWQFDDRSAAMKLERQIKLLSRRDKDRLILGQMQVDVNGVCNSNLTDTMSGLASDSR